MWKQTLVVIDEGEMKGACARYTQEMRENFLLKDKPLGS
jgi:hypothetical protein